MVQWRDDPWTWSELSLHKESEFPWEGTEGGSGCECSTEVRVHASRGPEGEWRSERTTRKIDLGGEMWRDGDWVVGKVYRSVGSQRWTHVVEVPWGTSWSDGLRRLGGWRKGPGVGTRSRAPTSSGASWGVLRQLVPVTLVCDPAQGVKQVPDWVGTWDPRFVTPIPDPRDSSVPRSVHLSGGRTGSYRVGETRLTLGPSAVQ